MRFVFVSLIRIPSICHFSCLKKRNNVNEYWMALSHCFFCFVLFLLLFFFQNICPYLAVKINKCASSMSSCYAHYSTIAFTELKTPHWVSTTHPLNGCWNPFQYKYRLSWYKDSHCKDKTVVRPFDVLSWFHQVCNADHLLDGLHFDIKEMLSCKKHAILFSMGPQNYGFDCAGNSRYWRST